MHSIKIANFEQYEICDDGTVISLATNLPLTPVKQNNGYVHVTLHDQSGRNKQVGIHTLVAEHFIPNPYHRNIVNHINGNKQDNRVENLEWCTSSENSQHALKTGLCPGRRFMSMNDRILYLNRVLAGEQVKDLAVEANRRPETLHKMLRDVAKKLGIHNKWVKQMKINRKEVSLRNLDLANKANKEKYANHNK